MTPVTELQTPELSVLGFIGTWCGDTHVLLPAFVKLLDVSAVPRAKLQLIAVGRDKRGPQVERFQVTRLPTFILMHNGKELGRITESPETTLAGDLERILRRH